MEGITAMIADTKVLRGYLGNVKDAVRLRQTKRGRIQALLNQCDRLEEAGVKRNRYATHWNAPPAADGEEKKGIEALDDAKKYTFYLYRHLQAPL